MKTKIPRLWGSVKAEVKENFIAVNAYVKKGLKLTTSHLKKLKERTN